MKTYFKLSKLGMCCPLVSLLMLCAAIIDSRGAWAEQKPLMWVGDIPLAPSFMLRPNEAVLFDSPAMRITKITAVSAATKAQIVQFYDTHLSALGWKGENGVYHKAGEQLAIQPLQGKPFSETEALWLIQLSPVPTE